MINELQKVPEPVRLELGDLSSAQLTLGDMSSSPSTSTDSAIGSNTLPAKKDATARKSSSIFAEGLSLPEPKRHSLVRKTKLHMEAPKDNFGNKNKLEPSGLSVNHHELSETLQYIEKQTRLRRVEPLYSSDVLGKSFKYSLEQLKRKAERHLGKDYNIILTGKPIVEQGKIFFNFFENFVATIKKSNLVVHKNGTMNEQEPAFIIGDKESLKIVAFEQNPLYDHIYVLKIFNTYMYMYTCTYMYTCIYYHKFV